ncbi:phosphatidate cytidylyltransferase, partial [Micromonospora wenchangensis]
MSPLDPYSGTEPRGWERSDRPPALPWPDREVEPWSPRQSGTDLSAVPQAPPRPPVRRHDESPDGPYDPPVAGRPFADDDAPTSQLPPVRDDDAPTAQLTPVRDDT